MSLLINDETVAAPLIEARRENGLDRYDEVWDGVYVMSPLANNEHQYLVFQLSAALYQLVVQNGLGHVFPGANVSDRSDDWRSNYRVPDVLVFLKETTAENRGTHFLGGPEFAIEVVSKGDRMLEKLDFYAAVGTQELLVVDRDPFQLSLYRSNGTAMQRVADSHSPANAALVSDVLPVRFLLNEARSLLTVESADDSETFEIRIGEPLL